MDATEAREMLHASQARPDLISQVVPSPVTFTWDATIQDIIKQGTLGTLNYISVRWASVPASCSLRMASEHIDTWTMAERMSFDRLVE